MNDSERAVGGLDWDGVHGDFWVREQRRQDSTLQPFVPLLLDSAGVGRGQSVLDVGCGCGATTIAAAQRVGAPGHAVGVDISTVMLAKARELAEEAGLADADVGRMEFRKADAQLHEFEAASFDAAISRFGVMFFGDPRAAFRNIARALRPGGRLAFVCWQSAKDNPHISLPMRAIISAFPDALPPGGPQPPFSMADPDVVRELLDATGFREIVIEPVVRDLRVGDNPEQVLEHYLAQPMVRQLLDGQPCEQVDEVRQRIAAQLEDNQRDDGVYLGSAAWLVTALR